MENEENEDLIKKKEEGNDIEQKVKKEKDRIFKVDKLYDEDEDISN